MSWVDKYRINDLREMVEQKHAVLIGEKIMTDGLSMNTLLCGPAGAGKSVWWESVSKTLLGDEFDLNLMELNASDELRIDKLRKVVKPFSKKPPIQGDLKIVVMEEVDNAPRDVQQALRVIMEKRHRSCKFILTCNYPSNIIEQIISRCLVIRFHKLSTNGVFDIIKKISSKEGFSVTKNVAELLKYTSDGDIRFTINTLQAANKDDIINSIYEMTGVVKPVIIKALFNLISKSKFNSITDTLSSMIEKVSPNYFVKQLSDYLVNNLKLDSDRLSQLCKLIADYDERLTLSGDQDFQLTGLIAKMCIIMGD